MNSITKETRSNKYIVTNKPNIDIIDKERLPMHYYGILNTLLLHVD